MTCLGARGNGLIVCLFHAVFSFRLERGLAIELALVIHLHPWLSWAKVLEACYDIYRVHVYTLYLIIMGWGGGIRVTHALGIE